METNRSKISSYHLYLAIIELRSQSLDLLKAVLYLAGQLDLLLLQIVYLFRAERRN
jgi:hypothetical protein